ncbi:hypothetical protein BDU57DRAFT_593651 [Ampelomyces quisqualis]|uniref:SnoaL-like domain-containing protein n=1 Tax=Ampelomyces quisqualis TaxID=50730 RepID=A0A6A5QXE7_AMPQU|nr:hypothetical protein BDU57DRAFT_593651 [Ampelomyces quisqualis]
MTESLLKSLYHSYRHTSDIDAKGLYFSPTCMQICRAIPYFAATTREEIVQYLKDADHGKTAVEVDAKSKGVYTIRSLLPAEFEFSTPDVTAHIKLTPAELEQQARDKKWVGMCVDLWDEGPVGEGLLVKVQYWWREEDVVLGEERKEDVGGRGWRQCLHDIMYLGVRDGSEGGEGWR